MMTRYTRRSSLLALAALTTAACTTTVLPPTCGKADLVYVGLEGGRVEALRLNACTGALDTIGTVTELPRPRWMVADPRRALLYAASDPQGKEGSVVAFAINRASGALRRLGEAGTGGGGTTHLAFDDASSALLAANFGSGSVSSLTLRPDGTPDRLAGVVKDVGAGPHRRQAGPHAHGVVLDPAGRHALVADLGADRVFVYGYDRETRTLSAEPVSALVVPPASGPHHLVFGKDGRHAYLLNELSADVTALNWDAARARLTYLQSLPLSRPEFTGNKSGAELAMGVDGRFLYVANRGENALQVYAVDATSGELSLVQRLPSGGEMPWTFDIDAAGRWLLVANNRGGRLNLFAIDNATGRLTDTGRFAAMPAPISVTVVAGS